ncbi:MAG: hypothetical protein AB1742_09030, partial [bacterium]
MKIPAKAAALPALLTLAALAGCITLSPPGCSRKHKQGFVSYSGRILFPVYDTSDDKLTAKIRDATLKIHYSRYSTDFGPDDLKVIKSANLDPCVYLGDVPLIYADAPCAAAYGMTPELLARHWTECL